MSLQIPNCIGFIDYPAAGQVLAGLTVVEGWVFTSSSTASIELWLDGVQLSTSIERFVRPDVSAAYPASVPVDLPTGFRCSFSTSSYANGTHFLECKVDQQLVASQTFQISNLTVHEFYRRVYLDQLQRRAKLVQLTPLLCCVACRGMLELRATHLKCNACGYEYAILPNATIVMNQQLPSIDSPVSLSFSNHPYPPLVLETLERVHATGGWALEVGSGRRLFGSERLVQVELWAYPFTDIVNQTETLPFGDRSFDFVFSLAVTEHTPRPWVLAAEMQRVLKPGGCLHVDSAFLQPLHNYPGHYFNMSDQALQSLFNEIEIISLEPAPHQHPFFSISWILSHVLADLDPEHKGRLNQMTLAEFIKQLENFCNGQPNVLNDLSLPSERIAELAAGFTLHGRKR
jgi:hypothetical protein